MTTSNFSSATEAGREREDQKNTYFQLPDYSHITIDNEKYEAPEILFQPNKIGKEFCGIVDLVHNSLNCIDNDIRVFMIKNLHAIGGTTFMQYINDRVYK